jgi:hypothetical protein
MNTHLIILIFVAIGYFFSPSCIAQRSSQYWRNPLSLAVGIERTGLTYGYHFNNKNVLARDGYGDETFFQRASNISLLYAPSPRFGIELGLQNTEMDLGVTDRKFIADHKINDNNYSYGGDFNGEQRSHTSIVYLGCFDQMAYYTSPHLSLFYYPFQVHRVRPYVGAGMSLNYIHTPKNLYAEWKDDTYHESLQLKTHFPSTYTGFTVETGIQLSFKGDNKGGLILRTGVKYYFSGQKISGEYTNVNMNSGATNYTDQVTAGMSYLAFTMNIGFGIATKAKHDIHKEKEGYYSSRKKSNSAKGGEKSLEIQHKIVVHSEDVVVKIWDRATEDSDVLTFKLNDEILLEEYVLTKEGEELRIHLNEGDNHFVLEAISLGKFPPCTAAISIDDGVSQQTFDLNSDFQKSGAVHVFVE